MAKMIPDYIDQENSKLDGERMVFKWLSDSKIEGIVLHSLLQKNHKRKLIGEVDFLLISKRGLLCIEVKGGQRITRHDGQWYSLGKNNVENSIKDPFRQSKDCMYALKSYITDVYGPTSKESKFLFGYAVIFPECIFTGHGNDLVTEVLFDCRKQLSEFQSFIRDTFDYWSEQEKEKHYAIPDTLTSQDIQKMITLLRGDFAVVPSLNLEMQHIESQMHELTEEQYDALDITLTNKKVMIQGVAGTGKSLLALEKVRKMMAANKKVLYVCFNKNMAKLAAEAIDSGISNNHSFLGTYHKLLISALKGKENYYELNGAELSSIFLHSDCIPQKYDCLIIDEAQDLMHINVWESLDKFLIGGLEKGEWVMFYDPNQNIFNDNDDYKFALDYIYNVYSPAIIPLTKNCRNTEPIGRRTSAVTLVPPAKHMKISGPKVIMKTYGSNTDLLKEIKPHITALLTGGTRPEDIVILSKYKLNNSILSNISSICGLPLIEITDISNFQKRSLNYFTIQSYKGLESKVVFMVDINGFTSKQNRMINYVGMSRAKILLYVYYPVNLKEEYLDITEASLDAY